MPQQIDPNHFFRRAPSYVDKLTLRGLLIVSGFLAIFAGLAFQKHFAVSKDTAQAFGAVAFVVFFCLLGAGYIALAKLLERWTRRD